MVTDVAEVETGAGEGNQARRGAASSLSELVRLGTYLVLNVAAFLLIIRDLTKEEMGWYALVNVVVNLAYVVADLQMDKVAVRRVTQGEDPDEVVGAAFGVKLTGSFIATLATQVVFLLIGLAQGEIQPDVQLAALLASSQFFGETCFVVGSVFQAQLRAYLDVAPRLLYVVLRFVFTLVLLELGVPWWALFGAWVGAYAVGGVVAFVLARWRAGVRVHPRLKGTRALVREALTLGIAGLLGMATVQFGTLYLGITGDAEQVAVFNAAILPIQYLSLFGGVIAIVAFPLASAAWAARDLERFGRIDGIARTAVLALFLPVSVLLFQLPLEDLLKTVFGDGYGGAAAPLQLMSVALILASLMVWAGFIFLAVGRPRLILMVNAACLTVGVASCPLVVPRWGLPGLGWVGIAATAVGAIAAMVLLRQFTPHSFDARGTVRALACGALLWLALEGVKVWTDNVLVLGAVTALLYPALVLVTGVFPRQVLDDVRANARAEEDAVADALGTQVIP